MARVSSGYTNFMFQLIKQLKAKGLPEIIFDADFAEKEAENKERVASLLERLREKEKAGEYQGLELPWTELRQQYEADVAAGIKHDYIATQQITPVWKDSFRITASDWSKSIDKMIDKRNGKKRRSKKKPSE